MSQVSFTIETDNLRDSKLAIKIIALYITEICGECIIEANEGVVKIDNLK